MKATKILGLAAILLTTACTTNNYFEINNHFEAPADTGTSSYQDTVSTDSSYTTDTTGTSTTETTIEYVEKEKEDPEDSYLTTCRISDQMREDDLFNNLEEFFYPDYEEEAAREELSEVNIVIGPEATELELEVVEEFEELLGNLGNIQINTAYSDMDILESYQESSEAVNHVSFGDPKRNAFTNYLLGNPNLEKDYIYYINQEEKVDLQTAIILCYDRDRKSTNMLFVADVEGNSNAINYLIEKTNQKEKTPTFLFPEGAYAVGFENEFKGFIDISGIQEYFHDFSDSTK